MKRLKNLVSPRAQTNSMTPTSGRRQASKSSLASRPPLTIRVSTSPPPKEPVDVLTEQVSSLAERVSLLNKENIVEDENLGKEFRHVNEQLQEIQNRLSCLDEERKTFLTNTAILETEKRNIQEQLFIREREVQTLVRRCQSQEEKMRESAKLRVSNSNLSLQLEGLKTSLSMKEEEISQVENLQQELKECKEARDEMRSRWEKVKKDHNDVVDTLNSCFLNMQKMQDKLQEHDDERRRESQRAEVLLEKQRLVHQELENELKAESQDRLQRVEKMEAILRDNMVTTTALRRDRVELRKSLEEAMKLKDALTLKVAEMERQEQQCTKATQAEYDRQLRELTSSVEQKDAVIETLQLEVSNSMEQLMRISEETDDLRQEKARILSDHKQQLQKLEQTVSSLEGKLNGKEIENTVLATSLSKVEEEKADCFSELAVLRNRVEELEAENAFIMDMEQQFDDMNISVLEAQEDNDRIRETYEQAISDLQQQFDMQKQMWDEMEKGLTERVAALELENSNLSANMLYEQELCKTMRASVQLVESKHERVQQQAACQDEMITEIQNQLERQRRLTAEKEAQISQLKAHNDEMKIAEAEHRTSYEKSLKSLRQHLEEERSNFDVKCEELSRVRCEFARARDDFQSQLSLLKVQLQTQESLVASLSEKVSLERRSKIEMAKAIREENEVARQAWRIEMDEVNRVLIEKRSELESLQSELRSISDKSEEDDFSAKWMLKNQNERLNALERELDQWRQQLHEKTIEADGLRIELVKTQEQLQSHLTSMTGLAAEHEHKIALLELDLKHERSVVETKESALLSLSTDFEALQEEIYEKTRLMQTLEEELETQRTEFDVDRNQNSEILKTQQQQISLLTLELQSTEELLEIRTDERNNLQVTVDSDASELFEVREQLNSQVKLIEELQSQLANETEEAKCGNDRVRQLKVGLDEMATNLAKLSAERESLLQEKVELQAEIAEKDRLVRAQLDNISSLNQQNNVNLEIVDRKATAVDDLKAELVMMRANYEHDIEAARKKLADEQSLVSQLRAELHRISIELSKKETNILSLSADVENHRFKFDQESKSWTNLLAEKDETIASKQRELVAVKSLLEEGTADLQEELRIQIAKVCSLTKTITQMELDAEENDRKNRAIFVENDAKVSSLLQEIQAVRQNKNATAEQYREMLKSKDENISSLNKRLEDILQEMETRTSAHETELNSFKHKLQKAEIDLAIAEDELRDLKMIDLKEAEETIQSLESNLHSTRVKARNQEKSSNSTISDLQTQLQQLETKVITAERGMNDAKHLHEKSICKLQGELEVLRQENEALHAEVTEKVNKLNERHKTISSLSTKNADLEQKENQLLSKISSLESLCNKVREENEKMSVALDRAIAESCRNDNDIDLLQQKSSLQKQLHDFQMKCDSLEKEVAAAEAVLESRTQVLADMVAHNKEAEERRERALVELRAEKEVAEERKTMLEGAQQEISRLKMNFSKVEDELLLAIQSEREMRELAELELENLHAKMRTKRDDRELTELEKENEALRDKVRRQEAYLLRKIQKDKVLRERNTKPSGIATPARSSGLRKPLSSTRKGRLTPVSTENLLDDDLDDLLS